KTWALNFGNSESNPSSNFPVCAVNSACTINAYVWKPSNGTKVGTILDGSTVASFDEAGTVETANHGTFTGAALTGITPGDACIIFEMWAVTTQATATSRTQTFYFDGTTV